MSQELQAPTSADPKEDVLASSLPWGSQRREREWLGANYEVEGPKDSLRRLGEGLKLLAKFRVFPSSHRGSFFARARFRKKQKTAYSLPARFYKFLEERETELIRRKAEHFQD